MPGPLFLAGETVELCTVERDDAEFLQKLINDPRIRETLFAHEPVTFNQEQQWIESVGDDGGIKLLICLEERPVGMVGLESPTEVWGLTEIGYWIHPDEWGNGYATDAVRCLCEYAFNELRLNKVYAKVFQTNNASCRVLEKVGFEREGTLRNEAYVAGEFVDVFRYGLLASELR